MMQIVKKLKLLNRMLKGLHYHHLGDILKILDRHREMLKKAQQLLQGQPLNNIFPTVERETYVKLKKASI